MLEDFSVEQHSVQSSQEEKGGKKESNRKYSE